LGQWGWWSIRQHRDERRGVGRALRWARPEERLDGVCKRLRGLGRRIVKTVVEPNTRALEGLDVVLPVEGTAPRKALVEHHAERIEVRAGAALSSERILGRHIGDITFKPKNILQS